MFAFLFRIPLGRNILFKLHKDLPHLALMLLIPFFFLDYWQVNNQFAIHTLKIATEHYGKQSNAIFNANHQTNVDVKSKKSTITLNWWSVLCWGYGMYSGFPYEFFVLSRSGTFSDTRLCKNIIDAMRCWYCKQHVCHK